MGLIDFVRILRRRWLIIAVSGVAGLVLAAGYNSTLSTTYTSTSRVYVSMATGTSVSDAYQGNMAAQQRVTSYVNLVTSSTVMEGVIKSLQLNTTPGQLQSEVSATFAPATVLIEISVNSPTAEGARVVNDAVIQQFRNLVNTVETTEIGAAPAAKVTVIDPAQTPNLPSGPPSNRNLLLGLLAGLGLGGLGALLRDRLDTTVRSSRDIEKASSVPLLGTLTAEDVVRESQLVALRIDSLTRGKSNVVVALESLAQASDPRYVLALTEAFSGAGNSVVVVDADFESKRITGQLSLNGAYGLSDLLLSDVDPMSVLVASVGDDYYILPAGSDYQDAESIFTSRRFASAVSELRAVFDYVLIASSSFADSPVDALGVALRSDGVLFLAEIGRAKAHEVSGAVQQTMDSGAPVLGIAGVQTPSRLHALRSKYTKGTRTQSKSQSKSQPKSSPNVASGVRTPPVATPVRRESASVAEEPHSAIATPMSASTPPVDRAPEPAEPAAHSTHDEVARNDFARNDFAHNDFAHNDVVDRDANSYRVNEDDYRYQERSGADPEWYGHRSQTDRQEFATYEESIRYDTEPQRYRNPPGADRLFDNYDPLVDYDPLGAYPRPTRAASSFVPQPTESAFRSEAVRPSDTSDYVERWNAETSTSETSALDDPAPEASAPEASAAETSAAETSEAETDSASALEIDSADVKADGAPAESQVKADSEDTVALRKLEPPAAAETDSDAPDESASDDRTTTSQRGSSKSASESRPTGSQGADKTRPSPPRENKRVPSPFTRK
ncbi:Wzz/FepE/Etk N-terminal domain-containing protein [Rhodococcus sp. P1Y]|uniref:Wzz/FepE/Etk N-terminal domain-containing protein n=1 Tax=Rhodococcus sp. P1Y TaxID=1302308 RepID=UPI000EAD4E3C|nr:Wzz/FepE/Etk N-terminal domain-containing protein [Rhodococcus sp. P1Y]AYJ48170.1 hypothetical protein D8W71_07285 [Rhodococcus sp. P1Y]